MIWKVTGRIGDQGHNTSFLVEADDKDGAEMLAIASLRTLANGPNYEIVSVEPDDARPIRTFTSGATRDTDTGKLDYEGFLSPLVLKRFAEYMHAHRRQPDGSLRASDNWQKGIPVDQYMKSLLRHVMDVWTAHRNGENLPEEELCGVLFNTMGLIYETLVGER